MRFMTLRRKGNFCNIFRLRNQEDYLENENVRKDNERLEREIYDILGKKDLFKQKLKQK